jgi:hypothetical protein
MSVRCWNLVGIETGMKEVSRVQEITFVLSEVHMITTGKGMCSLAVTRRSAWMVRFQQLTADEGWGRVMIPAHPPSGITASRSAAME